MSINNNNNNNNNNSNRTLILKAIYISIIKNYLCIKKIFKNPLFKSVKISRVSYIFSYTVVQFCPTVGESLLASSQPQYRDNIRSLFCLVTSLVSFCTILKASVKVTRC